MFIIKHETTSQYLYEIWPSGKATFTQHPELAREFKLEAAKAFTAVLTAALGEPFECYSPFLE